MRWVGTLAEFRHHRLHAGRRVAIQETRGVAIDTEGVPSVPRDADEGSRGCAPDLAVDQERNGAVEEAEGLVRQQVFVRRGTCTSGQ